MRYKLYALFILLAGTILVPSVSQARDPDPCRTHLGVWPHHAPPQYCCPPEWRWYIIRLRDYPNEFCRSWKGTLEPYDENGLLLPPTSRPGMLPLTDPLTDPLTPPKNAQRTLKMKTQTIGTRK